MLNAIIFDMDGVLLDSERHWPEIEYERYRKLIPGWTHENHKLLTGLSLNDSYRMFVDKFGLDMTWEEYDGYYRNMAKHVYRERTNYYPGAEEFLCLLRGKGIPLGLATSSPTYWLEIIFESFKLDQYFDHIVTADDVGGRGKPAPDIYEKAVSNTGLKPDQCIAIEDSYNGLLAAKRAGLYSIGFRNGHNDEADFSDADLVVHGFTGETKEAILGLLGKEKEEEG
jgi:HAD superfamily hydrolase (TIGR01509 family)